MSAARATLTVQSNNANALTMSWLMPPWLSFIEPASEERNCLQQNPASHESELAEARGGETRLTSKVMPEQHAGREPRGCRFSTSRPSGEPYTLDKRDAAIRGGPNRSFPTAGGSPACHLPALRLATWGTAKPICP